MGNSNRRAKTLRYICLAAALLSTVAPVNAQIYSWRDANGNLVLSNKRPGSVLRTYAVPEAEAVRVTRPLATGRDRLYDELIAENARLNGVRLDLIRAVVHVESGFNPSARSPKGALGLMQLMPATIREFGVRNPFSAAENIRAGVSYLRQLLDRYGNNEELALAAYNAGPAAIDRHGQTVPPYRETKDYVTRVNQLARPAPAAHSRQIYRIVEIVDGRPVPRYTDQKPATGSYDTVGK
jgi:soluble lytic murein transglycosylase-like protein